jgi:DNA-binding NarL/FixJ family response regulator
VLQPITESSRLAWLLARLGGPLPDGDGPSGSVPDKLTPQDQPPLTVREREILHHIAAGLQNKEIAARLGLSPATVRNHVHHILDKLQVHSKLEAVSLAFHRGWVQHDGAQRPAFAG